MTMYMRVVVADAGVVSCLQLMVGCLLTMVLVGCATSGPDNPRAPKSSGGKYARIETDMGHIKIEFFENDSPRAVENFRLLAKRGYYDGLTFHRVIKGFMIQGGDPRGDGTGGESAWGGSFDDEIDRDSALYRRGYRRGIVAMANSGPDTNGSQFFVMHGNSRLPPNYVIFGNVVEGPVGGGCSGGRSDCSQQQWGNQPSHSAARHSKGRHHALIAVWDIRCRLFVTGRQVGGQAPAGS